MRLAALLINMHGLFSDAFLVYIVHEFYLLSEFITVNCDMSTQMPPWLRGAIFGSHGDIYAIDINNRCLEKHTCCEDGRWYNRPLKVKFTNTEDKADGKPQAVAYLSSEDDQRKRILVTMDNHNLVFVSADLTIQDRVKLKGRCSGISVAKLGQSSTSDPVILLLNSTDNSLDVLNTCGETLQSILLPQKLGLLETHGYLSCSQIEGSTFLAMSSSRGVFIATLEWIPDEGLLGITLRDELLTDEQFSPQGVCLLGSHLYIVNSRKNRVLKMRLVCGDSGVIAMKYLSYMSVCSPCALGGRVDGDGVSICVTTLTGRYEVLDF